MKSNILSQQGSTLIQVLITAGMMTAMALVMAQVFLQQNRQIKFLEQKSETIDIKNQLLMTLQSQNVCGCNLNPLKLTPTPGTANSFNGTVANSILNLNATGLRETCNSSIAPFLEIGQSSNTNLKIESIRVIDINHRPVGADNNRFIGKLVIGFSPETTMIKLKDITLPIEILTVQTAPDTANTVESCKVSDGITSCKALGGEMVDGKCKIVTTPSGPEDCSIYGTGWTFAAGRCVPPASAGSLSGICGGSGFGSSVVYPSLPGCSCAPGYTSVKLSTLPGGADGSDSHIYSCLKN